MKNPPFVCGRCARRIENRHDRYHARLEFRREDAKERRHVHTLKHVCKACADAIDQQLRGGGAGEQESLESLLEIDGLI